MNEQRNGDGLHVEPEGGAGNPIGPPLPYKPCGAKKQVNGDCCRAAAMQNGRCRLHGGLSPKGMASTNWKHGKHSAT